MSVKELWLKVDDVVKEMLRIFVLAGASAVVTYLISVVSPFAIDGSAEAAIWFLILAFLRGVDRKLHEMAPEGEAGGLVRF